MIHNCFPRVTKDKRNYGLKKMNAVFMVANLRIPFSTYRSPNSHKNEMRLYKCRAAGRGLLVNDWHLLYQMAFFLTALSEREEKKDTAPFMFLGLCVIIFA